MDESHNVRAEKSLKVINALKSILGLEFTATPEVANVISLRASVSDILTVQTIGRGLWLPFGRQVSRDLGLSEEERKELLDIDTLEVISHEKYSAVLAKVKADPDWDISVASEPDEDKESRQIDPDGAEKYRLKIPVVVGKLHSGEINLTDVKISYERLPDLDMKLVGVDLATLEERDYDKNIRRVQRLFS